MELHESVLFGSGDVQTVKKIYNRSTYDRIACESDKEKRLVETIVTKLGFSKFAKSPVIYCCLQAASSGPDTASNPLLNYMQNIDESIAGTFYKKVSLVMGYIKNNSIEVGDKIDDYLLNDSLYQRSDQDFEYAVKAFDAVLHKTSKYFSSSGSKVSVHIDKDKLVKFFDTNQDYYYGPKDSIEYTGDQYADNIVTSDVSIDQRFFFATKQVSKDGTIIPSGIGKSSDDRSIWNYMEIWTNSIDRNEIDSSDDERQRQSRNQKSNAVKRAKKIINDEKNSMSDEDRQLLSKIMDILAK